MPEINVICVELGLRPSIPMFEADLVWEQPWNPRAARVAI